MGCYEGCMLYGMPFEKKVEVKEECCDNCRDNCHGCRDNCRERCDNNDGFRYPPLYWRMNRHFAYRRMPYRYGM